MAIDGINDYLKKCLSYRERYSEDKYALFFRGEVQDYHTTTVVPSIYRSKASVDAEDKIFKEVIDFFPEEMQKFPSTIEKLIFMRHYTIPNRILDVTGNPLCGLFFGCYHDPEENIKPENDKKDGVVHVFAVPKEEIKFYSSDTVSVIANICKRPKDFSIKGITHLNRDDFNKEDPVQQLVHDIREDKHYFQNLVDPKGIQSVVCVHSRLNNQRVIRQDGYFFAFGITGDKKDCAKMNPEWILDPISIPAKAKSRLLKELNFLHINAGFLYADYRYLAATLKDKHFSLPTLGNTFS
jgi:hypothetical protein